MTRRQLLAKTSVSAAAIAAWSPEVAAAHRRRALGTAARAHRAADAGSPLNILYANAGGLQAAIADLPAMAKSPFGVVLEYSVTGADTLPFADAAQRAGLKVLWYVRDLPTWGQPSSLLDRLDSHPATYGFYVAEEPASRAPVQAVCSILGARNHPRVGTVFAYGAYDIGSRLSPLLGLTEIITCAAYPVGVQLYGSDPNIPLSSVGSMARTMSTAGARHNFTPAMTMQAFAWNQDPTLAMSPDFARWPTRAEMKVMHQQAIGGGMRTLFWFTRWAVTRAYDPAARWADVCAAAGGRS